MELVVASTSISTELLRDIEKLGILKLNSLACERAFKWLNAFKNLRTMTEPRFKFLLIYMIDLHNFHLFN